MALSTNVYLRKNKINQIYFEPTNLCNLKCPLCSTPMNRYKNTGFTDLITFKKILKNINEILPQIKRFCLWGRGEPFLNKNLEKMIFLLSRLEIYSVVNTNGLLLNRKRIKKILESGLSEIIFSIDGITQKTYAQYRIGGNLKQVLKNLDMFIQERNRQKAKTKIIWQFLVMRHNEHELERLKSKARNLGVDQLVVKKIGHVDDEKVIKRLKDFLPQNKKFIRNHYLNILKKNQTTKKCDWFNKGLTIFWDGEVVSCNYDVYAKTVYGNIAKEKLNSIIKKKKYKINSLCMNCASDNVKGEIIELFEY